MPLWSRDFLARLTHVTLSLATPTPRLRYSASQTVAYPLPADMTTRIDTAWLALATEIRHQENRGTSVARDMN